MKGIDVGGNSKNHTEIIETIEEKDILLSFCQVLFIN